jgi:competence protein ComEC
VTPDLRLLPAALAAWAVALAGLHLGWSAAAALGAAGVGAVVAGARSRRRWTAGHHPVHQAADRGAAATLEVVLRDDPRPVASSGYGGRPAVAERVVVRSELASARIGDRQWVGGGRLVLLAPAEGWTGLLPGQRVRAEGLLAPAGRADLTVAVLRVRGAPRVLEEPSAMHELAGRLRSGLRNASAVLAPEPAGLLPALVVGDTSAMVPAVREEFRAAGLTHLTAVSGTNVAIICGAVLGLARLAGAGPRTAAVVAGQHDEAHRGRRRSWRVSPWWASSCWPAPRRACCAPR